MAEGHKLRTGTAGEVVEVDAAVHLAVDAPHGGAHRVDTVLTVGVGIDDLPGEVDELQILGREFSAGHVHG